MAIPPPSQIVLRIDKRAEDATYQSIIEDAGPGLIKTKRLVEEIAKGVR
jgi:hypothetical protein